MSFAIQVDRLHKNYGKTEALKGISLEMKEGEILGLLGPNGAGKTTLISILTTLEQATQGSARVFGFDVVQNPKQVKSLLGLVPQEIVSHGFFSVQEVLGFVSGYHGIRENREQIEYLLRRLSLWDHKDKKVSQLSGGMKRRFLIAKALVHKPKLLLLDEPTAGVDIELRANLWSFVRELHKAGTSVLLTTHYLEEAESLCDRVAIIDHGQIKKVGPTAELVKNLTTRSVEIHLSQGLAKCQSPYVLSQTESHLTLKLPSSVSLGEVLQTLKADTSVITDIKIREGTLEEAFLAILGESK